MPITLKIVSYQRHSPGQQPSFSTDRERISIGRNADNDLQLPDPQRFMSGEHCRIENRDGRWQLQDVSTNGVFINGSEKRIPKGERVSLNDGDRIKLGDYELEFSAQAAASPEQTDDEETDFFASKDQGGQQPASSGRKEENTPLSHIDPGLLAGGRSIDELHGLKEPEEEEDLPSLQGREGRAPPLAHHFPAPEVAPKEGSELPDRYAVEPGAIPDNWDVETGKWKQPVGADPEPAVEPGGGPEIPDDWDQPTGMTPAHPRQEPKQAEKVREPVPDPRPEPEASSEPRHQPRHQPRRPAPRINADSALAALASGAGIDPSKLTTEDEAAFFGDLGRLLRVMSEGLTQALASRRFIKKELRVKGGTELMARDNNPLKWSTSAEETLLRLLTGAESAYLPGPDAVREALDDLNAHQLAALAGTEAALHSILSRFKPANLESRLGGGSALGRLIPPLKKARFWEFYKALYNEVSEAADDDFQQLFGSEFRRAYEDQLERIKNTRKESPE